MSDAEGRRPRQRSTMSRRRRDRVATVSRPVAALTRPVATVTRSVAAGNPTKHDAPDP